MTHSRMNLLKNSLPRLLPSHAKREADAHFRKLTDTYHDVNRALHRAETRVDTVSEDEEARLRRQRLTLKDQIAASLA